MPSLLLKFFTPFKPSFNPPSIKTSSTHGRRVHFVDDDAEPSPSHQDSKSNSKSRLLSSAARSCNLRNLSERLKSMIQTVNHANKSVNCSSTGTALKSVQPKLTRLFIGSITANPEINDEDATHECLLPPSPDITSNELGTTLISDQSREEPSSTHPQPVYGPLPKGRSEAITTWIEQSLDEYAEPPKSEYRHWVHTQRVVEWRRYRSRRRISKSRIGGSERHEILVVKLIGPNDAEGVFLRFERYKRDRCMDCAKGRNYSPLDWQRWYPDDRVTMLDGWPDRHRYLRCEEQVFNRREHQLSFMDLLIAAHLAVEAPWTDFWTRHDHWFAVLLGRILNGKMEKTHRLKQPVAFGVIEKYGETRGWDWFRMSTRHERRKIIELIHLCSIVRHREKVRLFHEDRSKVEEAQSGGQISKERPEAEEAKDNVGEKTVSK